MRKKLLSFFAVCLALILAAMPLSITSSAFDFPTDTDKDYVYRFNITVDNPCNAKDMDKDAVNEFWFSFTYVDKNGFGTEKNYKLDMSWSNGQNKNSEFLYRYFISDTDDKYTKYFFIPLAGKLSKVHIKLNMDGGEKLAFTVTSIYCGDQRISKNSDYVSSTYYDSEADISCAMDSSVLDTKKSLYFWDNENKDLTATELKKIAEEVGTSSKYDGQFKDQYGVDIDLSVLEKCIEGTGIELNQVISHSDEESSYKYTFWLTVENPINLADADYDEVEKFLIDMYYVDANGCGKNGKYTLDMSYSKELGGYKNYQFLSLFERDNDESYSIHFDVWLPGVLTNVESTLNMSGEKLVVDFDRITLNSRAVNIERDYVSSTYFDSTAKIKCAVPTPSIVTDNTDLASLDYTTLKDQYGANVSKEFFEVAKANPEKYIYQMF